MTPELWSKLEQASEHTLWLRALRAEQSRSAQATVDERCSFIASFEPLEIERAIELACNDPKAKLAFLAQEVEGKLAKEQGLNGHARASPDKPSPEEEEIRREWREDMKRLNEQRANGKA
jgi:hypothetical protein